MLVGPNTATGHTSVLLYAEAQIEYVLQCLRHVERSGARAIEVREETQHAFSEAIREKLQGTVWLLGRLQLLVPQRARRHLGALARHDVGVRRRPQAARPLGLRARLGALSEPAAQPVAA